MWNMSKEGKQLLSILAATSAMALVGVFNDGTDPIDTSELLRNYKPQMIGGKVVNLINHPCGSRKARNLRKGGRP